MDCKSENELMIFCFVHVTECVVPLPEMQLFAVGHKCGLVEEFFTVLFYFIRFFL